MTAGVGTCQSQAMWPATAIYSAATATLSVPTTPILVVPTVTVANKIFDGTTAATISGCSLSNVLPADAGNVICSAASGTFLSAGADVNIPVTVTGITLGGSAAANYQLMSTTTITTANISFAAQANACVVAPAGITGWWKADGNATDVTGLYNGTLGGDTTFAPGQVGQAFSFDGTQSPYVALPAGAFPAEPSASPFSFGTIAKFVGAHRRCARIGLLVGAPDP
jgi:trimeric autotransporter adhesin